MPDRDVSIKDTQTNRGRIARCPHGACDLDSLCRLIAAGWHEIELIDFARRLGLDDGWNWEDVRSRIDAGEITAEEVDDAIHAGLW